MPFRQTHHVAGAAVQLAEKTKTPLSELTLADLQALHPAFDQDVNQVWDYEQSVERRDAEGGTSRRGVLRQIAQLRELVGRKLKPSQEYRYTCDVPGTGHTKPGPSADQKPNRVVEQIDDNLEIILSESQRLTSLINSLLDLEKIELGKMEWQIKPVECADVIHKAAAATAPLFQTGSLRLVIDVPQQIAIVQADEDKLIQVVINLLSNAAKFTSQGTVRITAVRDDHEIIVSVSDDGPRIAPVDQARVFEKFIQVGDTLTGKPQGTGLAAISKEIIDRHGWRIWSESEPGRGSVFSFAIPVYDPVKIQLDC